MEFMMHTIRILIIHMNIKIWCGVHICEQIVLLVDKNCK